MLLPSIYVCVWVKKATKRTGPHRDEQNFNCILDQFACLTNIRERKASPAPGESKRTSPLLSLEIMITPSKLTWLVQLRVSKLGGVMSGPEHTCACTCDAEVVQEAHWSRADRRVGAE